MNLDVKRHNYHYIQNTPKNPQPLEEELQTCKLLQSILYVQVKVAPTLQEQLIVSELPNRLVDIL